VYTSLTCLGVSLDLFR